MPINDLGRLHALAGKGIVMTWVRAVLLAGVLVLSHGLPARAQMMGPGMPAPGGAPGGGGAPPCLADFVPLRDEAQKRAVALNAAGQRKAPPQELCKLLRTFVEAEAKVVKFMADNSEWCGIPAQVGAEARTNHERTLQMRQKVCAVAENQMNAPTRPRGPGLSEALGTQRPQLDTPATGRGTFDTLTGSAIKR